MALLNPFRSAFTENNLFAKAEIACNEGTYTELGRNTVKAGQALAIGYGVQSGQQSAEGRLYLDLQDEAGGAINGFIRFELRDPQDRPVETLFEARTEQLRTSNTDRRQQLPMPEDLTKFGQDWSLVCLFKADADKTVSQANSTMYLDITNFTDR